MPKAICEDCGSLVEAELTHNGVCVVGHYVHCGWGHDLSPDDLISGQAADRIEELEGKLAKAAMALKDLADCVDDGCFCSEMQMATAIDIARTTLAVLKGQDDE